MRNGVSKFFTSQWWQPLAGGRSKGETSRGRVLRSADVTVTTRSLLGQHSGVDVVSVADVDTADHDDDDTYFIPFGSRRRRGDKCIASSTATETGDRLRVNLYTILVFNQPPWPTQPGRLSVGRYNEYWRRSRLMLKRSGPVMRSSHC